MNVICENTENIRFFNLLDDSCQLPEKQIKVITTLPEIITKIVTTMPEIITTIVTTKCLKLLQQWLLQCLNLL